VVNGRDLLTLDRGLLVETLDVTNNEENIIANRLYKVNTLEGAVHVYMPYGEDGDRIVFIDANRSFSTYPFTLNQVDIQTILGKNSLTLSNNEASIELIYSEDTKDWLKVTGDNYKPLEEALSSINLKGEPTTTSPLLSDASERIATTDYVKGNLNAYLPLDGGTVFGNLNVSGNLTTNGETISVNSVSLLVEDKNISLGITDIPTDITATGGGVVLKGSTDKTLCWAASTGSWVSSENIDLKEGKAYKINGVDVLTSYSVLGKTLPEGDIIGTVDKQTLTNKTLESPVVSNLYIEDSTIKFASGVKLVAASSKQTTVVLPSTNGTILTSGDIGTITDINISNTARIRQSKIRGLVKDLASKAPIVSPILTGIPKAPTAPIDTNSSQIATTAFVNRQVDKIQQVIDSLPTGLIYKDSWDASQGVFPSGASEGWLYYINKSGFINDIEFKEGDSLICLVDNASTNIYAGNWSRHAYVNGVQTIAGKAGVVRLTSQDIDDFDIAVESLIEQSALNVIDSADLHLRIDNNQISGTIVNGSIDDSKLSASINDSLSLADTALQPTEIGNTVQAWSSILQETTASFTVEDKDKLNILAITSPLDNILEGDVGELDLVLFQDSNKNIKAATALSIAELVKPKYFIETSTYVDNKEVISITPNSNNITVDLVINPKGSGSLLANTPDNKTTGGNLRGVNALDLQLGRDNASQVSSGDYSALIGGFGNTASGEASIALGKYANTKNRLGTFALASGKQSIDGDSQLVRLVIRGVLNKPLNNITANNLEEGFFKLDEQSIVSMKIRLNAIEKGTSNVADIEINGINVVRIGEETILLSQGFATAFVDYIGLEDPIIDIKENYIILQVKGIEDRDIKVVGTVEVTENVYL
jgi:hypothetical protein